jgi:CcmD family protein
VTPAEKYTAAAYIVVFLGVFFWILIISAKLQRLERQLAELTERLRSRDG